MRIRLLNLLLLAALVLAVSRLWLFLGEPPPALPAVKAGVSPPAPETTEQGQDAEVPPSRPEAYDVIVARDLFSPARGVVPPAAAAAARPAPKPQPAPKLTLSGVVILDGEKTAFLQEGTQEARPRKVRENENFAGGVLKTIRPDGVIFLFAGTEINVPLRTPKDGAGASSTRGQGAGGFNQQAEAPAALPRRLMPTDIQQGQMPVPGRPTGASPRMQEEPPPEEPPEEEVSEDEEFPEESLSGDEELMINEEEEPE